MLHATQHYIKFEELTSTSAEVLRLLSKPVGELTAILRAVGVENCEVRTARGSRSGVVYTFVADGSWAQSGIDREVPCTI